LFSQVAAFIACLEEFGPFSPADSILAEADHT